MKILLKCDLSLGDIVMLTAAVRDLATQHPGVFDIHVKTSISELWENNPYVTVTESEEGFDRIVYCHYPIIQKSNTEPWHFVHGYTQHLEEELSVKIRPTRFHGDIHLSDWEKGNHPIPDIDLPYWIVIAGGKNDFTTKWWSSKSYQKVIDHFVGKKKFVQLGSDKHNHPRLIGAIDFLGSTSIRDLIRFIYHSNGLLCQITGAMLSLIHI